MADYWEDIVDGVEALLPAQFAGYEAQVFIAAAVTTALAFLREPLTLP